MSKKQSVCKRIIFLSEQIALLKKMNRRQKQMKFIYSRLYSSPPSVMFIDSIIAESDRLIVEYKNDIKKLMLPLLKGVNFDINVEYLSTRDIYRGYIELYDADGKEYILFFKTFETGPMFINEGSLMPNDNNQLARVLEEIKPIKRDPEIRTLFDIIMNQKD